MWPLLLIVGWGAWRERWNLAATIAVPLVASLAMWLWLVGRAPDATFYLATSRLWQILAGALLVVPAVAAVFPSISRAMSEVMAGAGLLLIGTGVLAAAGTAPAAELWAILPVAGAALLIAAAPQADSVRRLLSLRPLVWIGLISYPLYLWHWPLLSFLRIDEVGEPLWPARVAMVGVSVLLAWATYRWIERPVRSRRWRAVTAPRLAMAMGVVCAAGLAIAASGGVPSRLARSPYLQIDRGFSVVLPGTQSCDADDSDLTQCRVAGVPNIALVGDSHADALFHGFLNSGDAWHAQAMIMSRAGCQPALQGEPRYECAAYMRDVLEQLRARSSVMLVIITGNSDFAGGLTDGGLQAFVVGYAQFVDALRAAGKRVVFMSDVPSVPFDPADCMRPRVFTRSVEDDALCRVFPPIARPGYDVFVERLLRRVPDLDVFDPSPVFCGGEGCRLFIDDVPQYKDGDHLSHDGSLRVAQAFLRWVGPRSR